jgi:hypothetical protein
VKSPGGAKDYKPQKAKPAIEFRRARDGILVMEMKLVQITPWREEKGKTRTHAIGRLSIRKMRMGKSQCFAATIIRMPISFLAQLQPLQHNKE